MNFGIVRVNTERVLFEISVVYQKHTLSRFGDEGDSHYFRMHNLLCLCIKPNRDALWFAVECDVKN